MNKSSNSTDGPERQERDTTRRIHRLIAEASNARDLAFALQQLGAGNAPAADIENAIDAVGQALHDKLSALIGELDALNTGGVS